MKTIAQKLKDFIVAFFENEKYSRVAGLTISGLLVLSVVFNIIRAVL